MLIAAPYSVASRNAIHITLDVSDTANIGVAVTMALTGDADGATDLSVADQWAGSRFNPDSLRLLTVTSPEVGIIRVNQPAPHRWRIRHPPAQPLTVRYWIHPSDAIREPGDGAGHYQPIVRADLVHLIGWLTLPLPERAAADISVRWQGVAQRGWQAASSLGLGNAGPVRLVNDGFENRQRALLMVAGKGSMHTAPGNPSLHLFVQEDDWALENDDLLNLITRLQGAQTEMLGPLAAPGYLVSVISMQQGNSPIKSIGGASLTDAVALQLDAKAMIQGQQGQSLRWLIAHELLHQWIGQRLRINVVPESYQYWFTEGFTNYLVPLVLRRAELVGPAEMAAMLNTRIRDYYFSDARTAPNRAIAYGYWFDPALQRLPHDRGAVVAMNLDAALRAAGTTLAAQLRQMMAGGPIRPDQNQFWAQVAGSLEPGDVRRLRDTVENGVPIGVPGNLFEECLAIHKRLLDGFALGFDLAASRRSGMLIEVNPNGPAHRAGLRAGQRVRGITVQFGNADKPVRVQVEEVGVGVRAVEYLPRSQSIVVPQFQVAGYC